MHDRAPSYLKELEQPYVLGKNAGYYLCDKDIYL